MKIQNSNFLSIEQLQDQYLNQKMKEPKITTSGLTFQDILKQTAMVQERPEQVKFSKHAAGRLSERDIELTNHQLKRLNEGTQKASEKGIKESLVIVDSLSFIVNIPNNTVITAMDQQESKDNIYTNIDGAVVV